MPEIDHRSGPDEVQRPRATAPAGQRASAPSPSGRVGTAQGIAFPPSGSEPGSGAGPAFQASSRGWPVAHPGTWPLRSHLELGALPSAVPCARLHTKEVLWEWRLVRLVEIAELLVSELMTNAVEASRKRKALTPVRLRLSGAQNHVLIEIWDSDPCPPVMAPLDVNGLPDADEEHGRGLLLVATLSRRWNWHATPGWGGKVVWAEVTE